LLYIPLLADALRWRGDGLKAAVGDAFWRWYSDLNADLKVTPGEVFLTLAYAEGEESILRRWSELMERGLVKYGLDNWMKARGAEELARFKESARRHCVQYLMGLNGEEDHAAAILFNVSGTEYVMGRLQGRMGVEEKSSENASSCCKDSH
jgi:hypothetical protein